MATQTTLPARPIPTELPSGARLFVYSPDGDARLVALERAITVGRAASNALVLADSRASGTHARLRQRRDSKAWVVEDLGSTNGTVVNGRRCADAVLAHGDVVRLGDTHCVFESALRADEDSALTSIEAVRLERDLDRVAASTSPALILGPTGAGKGHFARQIAKRSGARHVHVNCAALPATLIEGELFGYEKGAFTGAAGPKAGLIEEADGGLLFLDEIGTLAPELQAKLLVAIEEGKVRRVGATRDRQVDVRFIAATNVGVRQAIEDGTFREDLYYRLAAHTVNIPALAARRPDILPIYCRAAGLSTHAAMSAEFLESLLLWRWPGNVRELLNLANTLGDAVGAEHDYHALPDEMTAFLRARAMDDADPTDGGASRSSAPTRAELERALDDCDGNVSELARRLGKHRNQVVRWLDAHGLR